MLKGSESSSYARIHTVAAASNVVTTTTTKDHQTSVANMIELLMPFFDVSLAYIQSLEGDQKAGRKKRCATSHRTWWRTGLP